MELISVDCYWTTNPWYYTRPIAVDCYRLISGNLYRRMHLTSVDCYRTTHSISVDSYCRWYHTHPISVDC
eukprot:3538888-Rhodomonas_salina.1